MSQKKRKTCIWKGASNTQYEFYIYPLAYAFNANQNGNYIYCRQNEQGLWVPIYIGQGDLADRAKIERHDRGECIRRRGATHFHCHLNDAEAQRRAEEKDLLKRYTNAVAPWGCNRSTTG